MQSRLPNLLPCASFYSFVSHFYFYIAFVFKINIVFISVNDSQNIFVSVIVTVTEILLVLCSWLRYISRVVEWLVTTASLTLQPFSVPPR